MTVEEFYNVLEGDYIELTSRISNEDRLRIYLYIFSNDNTFTNLCTEIDNNNLQKAFVCAHTLKSFSKSLSLPTLFVYCDLITKALHNNNLKQAILFLPALSREYTRVITKINDLQITECSKL